MLNLISVVPYIYSICKLTIDTGALQFTMLLRIKYKMTRALKKMAATCTMIAFSKRNSCRFSAEFRLLIC